MTVEDQRVRVGINIRAIGDIITFPFQPSYHIVFPARGRGCIRRGHGVVGQKIAGPIAVGSGGVAADGIGPIKRHLVSPPLPCAVEVVKRFAAPIIVGLIGRDAGLEEKIRGACLIPHDKNDVGLRAGGPPGQFGEIDAADPCFMIGLASDYKEVRILPCTFNESGLSIHRRHRLRDAREGHRSIHQPRAGSAIPPHSIDLEPVKTVLRVDVELDRVPSIDAGE